MKKELVKTLLWILVGIIWSGAHQLAVYLTEMQYSATIAPKQVDDDHAYTAMKTHHTMISLLDYVYFAGVLVVVYCIVMTWLKRSRPKLLTE